MNGQQVDTAHGRLLGGERHRCVGLDRVVHTHDDRSIPRDRVATPHHDDRARGMRAHRNANRSDEKTRKSAVTTAAEHDQLSTG
jgi:hypothetical protein